MDVPVSHLDHGLHDAGTEVSLEEATKWSQLGQIFWLSTAMFIGAFLSGLIPFYLKLNSKQIDYFVAFGAGLLLCTALAVIIPEGVNVLYEYLEHEGCGGDHHHEHHTAHEGEQKHHHHCGEGVIGWALVAGFLTMFLVDNLAWCGGMHAHAHEGHHHKHDEIDDSESHGVSLSPSSKLTKSSTQIAKAVNEKKKDSMTLGLLIHSLADGIAVGATKASTVGFSRLDLIVFTAIMMHKVPAAFGLAVILKGSDNSITKRVRFQLFSFAAAAPLGSLLTFLFLHQGFLGIGSLSSLGVAICLLFSGGTFLFVATVHAMGEVRGQQHMLRNSQILAFCCGCIIPLVVVPSHQH